MAQLIPSILEENIDSFNSKIAAVLKIPEVQRIQVDFADGKFVPHSTVLPGDIDLLNPAYQWEAHLMVQDPGTYFFDAKVAGFSTVIIHYEALSENKLRELAAELKKMNLAPGLAINPETEIEKILALLEIFESVTVMAVHPGFQGKPFLLETFERVKKLRNTAKNVIIEVDGGVKMSNISEISAAGADRIILGSALFNSEEENLSPAQNYDRLAAKMNSLNT